MDLDSVDTVLAGPAALDRADWADGDAFLGGGSWLFSEPQPRLRRLRDLTTLGWPPITVTDAGLEIAATCTLAELYAFAPSAAWRAAHELIGRCCEALLGSFKVLNVATVGGNICLGLPAGPMTSLTSALDGEARLLAPDGSRRSVAVASFVRGPFTTTLTPGELLRAVFVPARTLTGRTAARRISLYEQGRSAVFVIGRVDADGTAVITVTASVVRPVQLRFPQLPSPAVARSALVTAEPPWHDDVHGAPAWRRTLTERFVAEVVEELAT